jgi:hypothetical protein
MATLLLISILIVEGGFRPAKDHCDLVEHIERIVAK